MSAFKAAHAWSTAALSKADRAAALAIRYPSTMVWGCILAMMSFSASRNSSAASTHTLVVPSPTSSSWTFEIFTRIFAAALSSWIDLRIVAPSFVTLMSPEDADWRILFVPFGPSVDFTKSPSAKAPTKEERRAFSAFSSVAYVIIRWVPGTPV